MIVYTKTDCPWSREVVQLLLTRDISFTQKNVLVNPDFFEELILKSGQVRTPTVLFDDGELLVDTDSAALEKRLKEKNLL